MATRRKTTAGRASAGTRTSAAKKQRPTATTGKHAAVARPAPSPPAADIRPPATTRLRVAGIGDDAVRARTGRSWTEWFAILDAADALGMPHPDIAQLLYDKYGVDGWWAQMLTVGYEQARGRRRKNQKADGYAVNVSRTVNVPVAALYRAWSDVRRRVSWLGERGIQVRKATAEKSMRITWSDGTTSVDVNFYARGPKKSQVTCQHTKLARESDVERMRVFWKQALDTLKFKLEM